jgi:hypothetical protein
MTSIYSAAFLFLPTTLTLSTSLSPLSLSTTTLFYFFFAAPAFPSFCSSFDAFFLGTTIAAAISAFSLLNLWLMR